MKYVSKPKTCEAMQWVGDWVRGEDSPDGFTALKIVAWINDNGGEARYVASGPRISVATAVGETLIPPGWYVVRNERGAWYVSGPETFEKDWEPKS